MLSARGVHRAPLDIIGILTGTGNRRHHPLKHLILVKLKLILAVQGRRPNEGVDATAPCRLNRLARPVNVAKTCARQAADHRVFSELGDLVDGFEVALRSDGKTSLYDIHAHFVEKLGNLQLFFICHRRAGALLAVAQRGVENNNGVRRGSLGRVRCACHGSHSLPGGTLTLTCPRKNFALLSTLSPKRGPGLKPDPYAQGPVSES